METKLIHINENGTELTAQEESGLRQAGEIIKSGGLLNSLKERGAAK